jgi:hypothetical protein
MRAIMVAALAGSLGACASATPDPSARDAANPQLTKASANVGKNLWVASEDPLGVELCQEPTGGLRGGGDGSKCEFVKKGKFTVQAVEGPPSRSGGSGRQPDGGTARQPAGIVYKVAFDDGRTGYIGEADLSGRTAAKDPVVMAADCKRLGNPKIGMTVEQVIATCWGKPEHITHTQAGAQTFDQYVYSGNRSLYFQDGVLRSFQASGQVSR